MTRECQTPGLVSCRRSYPLPHRGRPHQSRLLRDQSGFLSGQGLQEVRGRRDRDTWSEGPWRSYSPVVDGTPVTSWISGDDGVPVGGGRGGGGIPSEGHIRGVSDLLRVNVRVTDLCRSHSVDKPESVQ